MKFLTTQEYENIAKNLSYNTQALINGKLTDSISGETFPTVNPATGEIITSIASCGAEDIDLAVKAAREAFDSGKWNQKKIVT